MPGFALIAITVTASYIGVAGLRYYANRRNILDIPNERSSHTRPTPRGGGVAIVIVTLAGLLVSAPADGFTLVAYTTAALAIAAVSFWDDLRSLSTRVRFTVHAAGAIAAIAAFGHWQWLELPFLGPCYIGLLGLPLTFIWIVGLTNAYNFMDGIDGIAGAQALVAGLGWAALAWMIGNHLIVTLALLLAFTSLAFLLHNWPPARIFMGDVGSAFLGYSFAVMPLMLNASVADQQIESFSPMAAALLVWPFLFDTVFTFIRRLRKGENVFAAHRSHLYQRLVIAGYSHQSVTLLYLMLAAIGAGLAFLCYLRYVSGTATLLTPLLGFLLWYFVTRKERAPTISVSLW